MKKWTVPALTITAVSIFVIGLYLTVYSLIPPGVGFDPSDAGYCASSGIKIDYSSVETIIQQPKVILADPQAFLDSDDATLVFAKMHYERNDPLNVKRWLMQIEKMGKLPAEKRKQVIEYKFAREILSGQETWCKIVVPHVLSYLPEGTEFNTTVYLLAFDPLVSGQGVWGRIVMSLSHPLYINGERIFRKGATSVQNILAHELFHVGYSRIQLLQDEIPLAVSGAEQALLVALQNEGMAVRAAFALREYYPCPLETVYLSHQCKLCVRYMIGRVNKFFHEAASKPEAELYRDIRKLYDNSGVYMVGGYMAAMIEEHLGREALVVTLENGPRAFVKTYNSIAEAGMEVRLNEPIKYPDTIYAKYRDAAVAQDYNSVRENLDIFEVNDQPVDVETDGYLLYSAGYVLMDQGQFDLAEETFDILTEIFPDIASLYIGLGDVYVKKGEISQAIENYQKAMELEPRQQWLQVVIRELEGE